MKRALIFITIISLYSCRTDKEIQADITNAELVKIDTIYRYPNVRQQVLTWECKGGVQYVNFAPIENAYTLGSRIRVLVRK